MRVANDGVVISGHVAHVSMPAAYRLQAATA
jgi:hypothetical protein